MAEEQTIDWLYLKLVKGPVPEEKKHFEKNAIKKFDFSSLCIVTPRLPMSVHKKFQPIWSSRFAGYREHVCIRMSCFNI